ncbi:MAG: T9SS type A sorting domain-containing protein, partial [Cyclobacteriaceae bacterium]
RTLSFNEGDISENEDISLTIDNYSPAAGNEFAWYEKQDISSAGVLVSNDVALVINDFDPQTGGAVYYCIITNPALPEVTLTSNLIRVIGQDMPPLLTGKDLTIRSNDTTSMVIVAASDDYTPADEIVYTWPVENNHLILKEINSTGSFERHYVSVKTPGWTGVDSVTVFAEDEFGNKSSKTILVTVLPAENENPIISAEPIYMSAYRNYTPPCTPGTEGCSAYYILESTTYFRYIVSDDYTDVEDLEYTILEADASGAVSDYVFTTIDYGIEGAKLNVTLLAQQDTSFTVTLQVTDHEGGISTQQIQFIGNGTSPNQPPVVGPIEEQVILRGTEEFPALDLTPYISDDNATIDGLLVQGGPEAYGLIVQVEDNIASVQPVFQDSSYSMNVNFYLSEKINSLSETIVPVRYSIIDGRVISGTILDEQSVPLQSVELAGFPESTTTDTSGVYETRVMPDWEGKVYPLLSDYTFVPDTVTYTAGENDLTSENYTGTYVGTYTIAGNVLDPDGNAFADVEMVGLPCNSFTDQDGNYACEVPAGWSGTVTPTFAGYDFEPHNTFYNNLGQDMLTENYTAMILTHIPPGKGNGNKFRVYPNPGSKNTITFFVAETAMNTGSIEIMNAIGQVIGHIELKSGTNMYPLNDQSSICEQVDEGIYYAKLYIGTGSVYVVRFLVR